MVNVNPRYLTKLRQVDGISPKEISRLSAVSDKFLFRTNEYYNSLIDWNDPDDPIRRVAIPCEEELETWGQIDASNEEDYKVWPGLEHKYEDTAVLLVTNCCGTFCRFCFRKRLFVNGNNETRHDVSEGLDYIRSHPEINNVLLSGGDSLFLSTGKLREIIAELRQIDHVQVIRLGTKMLAFNPFRVINDPDFIAMLREFSTQEKRIYIMAHFNHPQELTREAREALALVQQAGAITVNQTPMIRGVNDNPEVMRELFDTLSFIGVPPYYVFQCRPTLGNKPFVVPLEEAFSIFLEAQDHCSGLARRARYIMSHATGKVEVVGMTTAHIFIRYHRAVSEEDNSRIMIFDRNPEAFWLDDYLIAEQEAIDPDKIMECCWTA